MLINYVQQVGPSISQFLCCLWVCRYLLEELSMMIVLLPAYLPVESLCHIAYHYSWWLLQTQTFFFSLSLLVFVFVWYFLLLQCHLLLKCNFVRGEKLMLRGGGMEKWKWDGWNGYGKSSRKKENESSGLVYGPRFRGNGLVVVRGWLFKER